MNIYMNNDMKDRGGFLVNTKVAYIYKECYMPFDFQEGLKSKKDGPSLSD